MDDSTEEEPMYIVLFLCTFFLSSIPVRIVLRRFNLPIPQNLFLCAISVLVTATLKLIRPLEQLYLALNIRPQDMMGVFLPIFLTAAIYRMDHYIFRRCLPQVLLITLFGVVFCTLISACILTYILHTNWTFVQGILAALTTLPMQPLHVVMICAELTKYKYLGTLLEAEAILLIIPVMILTELCSGINMHEVTMWGQCICIVLRYCIGGFVVGYVIGKVKSKIICWLYNEPKGALSVSIGMTFFTYYLSECLLHTSGPLAVVLVNYLVALERHRMTYEVYMAIRYFWNSLHYLSEIGILMICTVRLMSYILVFFRIRDIYGMMIMYLAGMIVRILQFLILGPILNQMTYELNFKCLLALIWGDVKSCIALNHLLILVVNKTMGNMMACIIEVLAYTVLSIVINNSSMKMVLKLMGFLDVTLLRKNNVDSCIKFILEKKAIIINILKMNRYMSNADWKLVRGETVMKDPYENFQVPETVKESEVASLTAQCPACHMELPANATEREIADLLKETHLRILKAKKVSIIKQYVRGIINRNCLQVLVHCFEIMLESSKQSDIGLLNKHIKPSKFLVALRKVMQRLCQHNNYLAPKRGLRRLFFYITMHVSYDFILFGITLANAVFSICYQDPAYGYLMVMYHIGVWMIYFTDFLLRTIGLSRRLYVASGLKTYFLGKWNIIDFVLLLMGLLNVYVSVSASDEIYNWTKYYIWPTFRTIAVIRLITFLRLLHVAWPYISQWIDYRIDKRVCVGFEMAIALSNCADDVLDALNSIIDLKLMRDLHRREMVEEKQELLRIMTEIQEERPWIAITVKTKQAIRTSLTAMEDSLNELKVSGFVDNIEYTFIYREIFDKQKILRNMTFAKPNPPKVIFNEVPWMDKDELRDFLFENAQIVSFSPGMEVYHAGKHARGIYIIVKGILQVEFTPEDSIRDEANNGMIPIVDYLDTTCYDEQFTDRIMAGNTMGELALLTGRPYSCSINAEVQSDAYFIPADVIHEAFKMSNHPLYGLAPRMWKSAVINLAVAILFDLPLYQSYSLEYVKLRLERAFMPNLKCYKLFVVTEMMDEVVLIDGIASDYSTDEVFVAPMLIPRTIQKLSLHHSDPFDEQGDSEVKLLIIPMGDASELAIMENEEDLASLVSDPSPSCLLHSSVAARNKVSIQKDINIKQEDIILSRESKSMSEYQWREEDLKIIVFDEKSTSKDSAASQRTDIQSTLLLRNRMFTEMSSLSNSYNEDEPKNHFDDLLMQVKYETSTQADDLGV